MNDDDDTTPSWARGATAAAVSRPPAGGGVDGGRWPRSATVAVIALLAIVAGLTGYLIGRDGDDSVAAPGTTAGTTTVATSVPTTAPATTATPTTATATTAPTTTAAPATTTAPSTSAPVATTAAPAPAVPATTTVPPTTAPPPPGDTGGDDPAAGGSERLAVFRGGKVYLRGRVPSDEVATAIAERAAAVVGPENVVVEYEVDPAAELPASAPLYVEDLVLFRYNSAVIDDDFIPILDLGLTLFSVNPAVSVDVIGHTDATGPADANLDLSQRRVDAVVDYWVERGVDPARIVGIGKGETEPLLPDAPTDGVNRRTEFIIRNILG